MPADVADRCQCQLLIERTVQEYGRIDTLINNVGVGMAAQFDQLQDLELFEKVFQINFFGSVYCTFYALPYLRKTRGRLVAVSSGRGLFPSASADAYGPSKHAMVGFFNSLRNELAPSGVSVTLIFPGWVNTGITTRSLRMDGIPIGELSRHEINAMSVETCARVTIKTIEKRKRQVMMDPLARLGLWMRLVAPGLVDRIVSSKTD